MELENQVSRCSVHWFAGHDSSFPPQVRKVVDFQQFGVPRPQFVPVLVTCSRQALGISILNSLNQTLIRIWDRRSKSKLAVEIQRLLDAKQEPTDDQILQLILGVNARIIAESKGKGLLLILDRAWQVLGVRRYVPATAGCVPPAAVGRGGVSQS